MHVELNEASGSPADPANNFEYRGWQVRIEVTVNNNAFSGHADLLLDDVQKCRVVLATSRSNSTSARWALDSKARDYIDDWHTRRHTGETDFGELGAI